MMDAFPLSAEAISGSRVQGNGCAVQLAAAVVGNHDTVRSVVHDALGVVHRLDALDHQPALPCSTQPVQVIEGQGRVEH